MGDNALDVACRQRYLRFVAIRYQSFRDGPRHARPTGFSDHTSARLPGGVGMRNRQTRYLREGMLPLPERTGSPRVSHTRGLDLSGTLVGAGGIGGLLARSRHATSSPYAVNGNSFYHADGNGNVTYLANSSGGTDAAYRYDPFGRGLAQTGPYASANGMRFSSKPWVGHNGSNTDGLYYYGYRFYDPLTQRWPNRDPLGEPGFEVARRGRARLVADGPNLYAFVRNDPIDRTDFLGLYGSSIDNAIRTCMARPTIYLQLECLDELLDTLGADLDDLPRKKIAHVRNCAVIHAAYKAAEEEGKGCRPGLTCDEYKKKVAAISLEVAGRSKYLKMKCDFCLPDSIARGSKKAEEGHTKQLATKTVCLGNCIALMQAACGEK